MQLLAHSFLCPVGWGAEWTKSTTRRLRYRQFDKMRKEGIIIRTTTIIIIIIKNMENKRYTIQLFSTTNDQLRSVFLSSSRRTHRSPHPGQPNFIC